MSRPGPGALGEGTRAAQEPAGTGPVVLALSAVLRARTAAAHAAAERSPFLTALVAGDVTAAGVAALLGRLAPVYRALEETGASWSADPVVGPFLLPGLPRSAGLAADLAALPAPTVDSPAADAYAARVLSRGATRTGFLAHHYTRTLGDLSGGQLMGAAVQRCLGLSLRFFAFPDLRLGEAKSRYRALLDAAPLTAQEREEVVEEALVAYRLNGALHAELDDDPALLGR